MTNPTDSEPDYSDAAMLARYKALPQLLQHPPSKRREFVRSGRRSDILAYLIWRAAMEEHTRGDAAAAAPWQQAVQAMRSPTVAELRLGVEYGVEVEHVFIVCDAETHNSAACRACLPQRRGIGSAR